jgi:hypothetical protein
MRRSTGAAHLLPPRRHARPRSLTPHSRLLPTAPQLAWPRPQPPAADLGPRRGGRRRGGRRRGGRRLRRRAHACRRPDRNGTPTFSSGLAASIVGRLRCGSDGVRPGAAHIPTSRPCPRPRARRRTLRLSSRRSTRASTRSRRARSCPMRARSTPAAGFGSAAHRRRARARCRPRARARPRTCTLARPGHRTIASAGGSSWSRTRGPSPARTSL